MIIEYQPVLTIGIPTFNRANKLDRLLKILSKEIQDYNLGNLVEIFISDNCSSDDTLNIVNSHKANIENLRVDSKKSNVGFDLNILSVYSQSKGQFVWFFADDDIPIEGSINKLLSILNLYNPDVLLFSFGQPPSSKKGVFLFDIPVYFSQIINESIELIMRWPKVSTYVYKRLDFSVNDNKILDCHTGDGWNHVAIGLTILNKISNPLVAIVSEVLAHCDEDFDMLTWSPNAIRNSYKLALHPIIKLNNPSLLGELLVSSYLNSIQFSFAAKIGTLRVQNMKEYDRFISDLPIKLVLLKYPKSLVQLFFLKFRLTKFYPKKH